MDWKILVTLALIFKATAAFPKPGYYTETDDEETLSDNANDTPSYQVTENVIDIPDDRTVRGSVIANHSINRPLNLGNNKVTVKTVGKEDSNWNVEDNAIWTSEKPDKESNWNGNNNNDNNVKGNSWNNDGPSSGDTFSGNRPVKDGSWSKVDNYYENGENNGNDPLNNGDWNSRSKPTKDILNKDEDKNENTPGSSKKNKFDILHINAEYDDEGQVIEDNSNKKCTLFKCIKNYLSGVKSGVVKGFRNLFGHKDESKSIEDEADDEFSLIEQLHKEIADDDFSDEFNF